MKKWYGILGSLLIVSTALAIGGTTRQLEFDDWLGLTTNGDLTITPNGTGLVNIDTETGVNMDAVSGTSLAIQSSANGNDGGIVLYDTDQTDYWRLNTLNAGNLVLLKNGLTFFSMNIDNSGRVGIGNTNQGSTLYVSRAADQVQLMVRGNSTQTNNLLTLQNSTPTTVASVDNAGAGSFTQVNTTAQGALRLQDTSGGEYMGIRAPGTVTSSVTLTLPDGDGTVGQAMITDGSGTLAWGEAGGEPMLHRNSLSNGDFKKGTSDSWTASDGTYSSFGVNFTILGGAEGSGDTAGAWDSDGAGQTLCHDAVDLDTEANWLKEQNGYVKFKCVVETSGAATHIFTVKDSGGNLLNTDEGDGGKVISCGEDDNFNDNYDNFIYPGSGETVQFCVESVASDEPLIGIDDAFLGDAANITNTDIVTAWESYTPATQGFGTVTVNYAKWRRVGDSMEIKVNLTAGTAAASEAQVGLPGSYTVGTGYAGPVPVGNFHRDSSNNDHMVVATDGDAFVNFVGSTVAPPTVLLGNQMIASGDEIYLYASIPIAQWSGSVSALKADQTNRPWTDYTPTFTGFGTVSNVDCQHRRQGENLDVRCKFTAGTRTATEAQVTLPTGRTIASNVGSPEICGDVAVGVAVDSGYHVLCTGGDTFINFGRQSAAFVGLTPTDGDEVFSNAGNGSFTFSVPIEGWTETFNAPLIRQSLIHRADNVAIIDRANLNCDSGSAITSQVGTWVSSIGNISAGACAITLNAGYSDTPYCWTEHTGGFATTAQILSTTASSATAVSVDCESDASAECTFYDFNLFCMGPR